MQDYSSISLINSVNNFSELLNNYSSRINERISKCHKIDIEELKLFCDKIIQESEKYNSNLENWYDTYYHEDVTKLHQNLVIFDEKIKLYKISNTIIIN
jgi:predicted translin family RNA/ssDNA-binding protein